MWERQALQGWSVDQDEALQGSHVSQHRCKFGGIGCKCCDGENKRWIQHKQQRKGPAGRAHQSSASVHDTSALMMAEVKEPPNTLVARPFASAPSALRPSRHNRESGKYLLDDEMPSKWGVSRLTAVVVFDSAASGGTSRQGAGRF